MGKTRYISKNKLREVLMELSQIPMANPLIELFAREIDPQTTMYKEGSTYYTNKPDYKDHEIFGKVKEKNLGVEVALALRQQNNKLNLDFYSGDIKEVMSTGERNSVFCNYFCYISAGSKDTGVWAYGKGDQKTLGISVHFYSDINLPTKKGRWFFNLMKWFSLISTELHLDIHEQPIFWNGDKENPP